MPQNSAAPAPLLDSSGPQLAAMPTSAKYDYPMFILVGLITIVGGAGLSLANANLDSLAVRILIALFNAIGGSALCVFVMYALGASQSENQRLLRSRLIADDAIMSQARLVNGASSSWVKSGLVLSLITITANLIMLVTVMTAAVNADARLLALGWLIFNVGLNSFTNCWGLSANTVVTARNLALAKMKTKKQEEKILDYIVKLRRQVSDARVVPQALPPDLFESIDPASALVVAQTASAAPAPSAASGSTPAPAEAGVTRPAGRRAVSAAHGGFLTAPRATVSGSAAAEREIVASLAEVELAAPTAPALGASPE